MSRITRRRFITSAAAMTASAALGAPAVARGRKPNLLLIITDQQHIETISAAGCPHLRTPALDRLCRRGVRFERSYSPNPLCSPARSAFLTGRTSCEAGVWRNGLPIRPSVPNIGHWLAANAGYDAVYAGKWHLPRSFTRRIPGFRVLAPGVGGQGNLGDSSVSRACDAFLRSRSTTSQPFLLVASFLQPHDICQWLRLNQDDPGRLPFPELADQLPALPSNFNCDQPEPEIVRQRRDSNEPGIKKGRWSKLHWRYYRWAYYRHVEMVEAEAGRILRALEETGLDRNTLVIFISDHGEGLAHHQMVRKNFLYDEAARVPLIVSWPGHLPANARDATHLVSPLDIMATFCDYAGIEPPRGNRGLSLRPLLEGRNTTWRSFLVSEVSDNAGRMVRTTRHKLITYLGDPVEQLFDMANDPGETQNLAAGPRGEALRRELRKLLAEWERRLDPHPKCPHRESWRTLPPDAAPTS